MFRDLLETHSNLINRLNVYPVPDGDTGTNMAHTVDSAVLEIDKVASAANGSGRGGEPSMAEVAKAVAHGTLMGARGNSGVILSQLLRGFTGVIKDHDEIAGVEIAAALAAADKAARDAVLKPVEGTLLTVARAAAEGAAGGNGGATLSEVVGAARCAAAEMLERTPEMLPVLAEAGVVDAGGAGFVLFFDALLHVVDGAALPSPPAVAPVVRALASNAAPEAGGSDSGEREASEPSGGASHVTATRYEVMYLLEAADEAVSALKDVLEGIGNSIVVVGGDGLWNCHVHTNDIGAAIEAALDAGRPKNLRVGDLAEQVREERWVRESALSGGTVAPGLRRAGSGPELVLAGVTSVVAVVNGEGIGRIFRSLGVHHHVEGGQSMNPSTAEMLKVVDSVESPEVVILPNNDNITPVALQVAEISAKSVCVVPTSGIVEGFAALLEFDPEATAEENCRGMSDSARRVASAEVTRAVRPATGPDGPIAVGDWLGLTRDGIAFSSESLQSVLTRLIGSLIEPGCELVTLIEGEGSSAAATREVSEWLADYHPGVSVEVHDGGQPLYSYLIGVE